NHVLDARKAFRLALLEPADVAGLPQTLLNIMAEAMLADGHKTATADKGPWKLTLDLPVLIPFLKYSERRDLREKLYREHITLASAGEFDNGPVIDEILALRTELARLLGYEHYAEVSLATKMAPNVDAVDALQEELRKAAYPRAVDDFRELREFAFSQGHKGDFELWDFSFWHEKLREQRFDFTDEVLRPYFQFPRVLEGLFTLTEKLFGVTIKAADGETPVWHKDVSFLNVHDECGGKLACFYLDPYSRPGTKQSGAWMSPVLPRDTTVEPNRHPAAYLVCNQTPPSQQQPSLMTFREVQTLFHEFGHGLQHLLTTVGEPEASGLNNIEWDAVELASQFMENWCYDFTTLSALTRHIKTGDSIPADLFHKVKQARTFHAGSNTLRQLTFGILDMELHARFHQGGNDTTQQVVNRVNTKTRILPPLPEDRSLCAFSHIFAGGYAAGYYSYKWSEVLSADAFAAFEEARIQGEDAVTETGRRFRRTILALGGGTNPAEVFRLFRGRDPDPRALLRQDNLLDETES
ncbi:MAG: M3 family metallopeptidase, partial [Verrucomicrobia bacterium]|nr:M3 family metallopeptidase [Verrucomicrobiota bacterium]